MFIQIWWWCFSCITIIPFYHDTPLNFYDRKVKLNGEYTGEIFFNSWHGFYTGDKVYYESYKWSKYDIVRVSFQKFNPGVFM